MLGVESPERKKALVFWEHHKSGCLQASDLMYWVTINLITAHLELI